jgi:hypothetical protein
MRVLFARDKPLHFSPPGICFRQSYQRQPWLYEGCPMEEEELVMYDFATVGITR